MPEVRQPGEYETGDRSLNHVPIWANVGKGSFTLGHNAQDQYTTDANPLVRLLAENIDNGIELEPPVRYYVMGAGIWREAETFPPANISWRNIT